MYGHTKFENKRQSERNTASQLRFGAVGVCKYNYAQLGASAMRLSWNTEDEAKAESYARQAVYCFNRAQQVS